MYALKSRNLGQVYSVKARTEAIRSSFIPSLGRFWNSLDKLEKTRLCYTLMSKLKPSLLYHVSRTNGINHAQ